MPQTGSHTQGILFPGKVVHMLPFHACSSWPCPSLFHKEKKIRKGSATLNRCKWIQNVLKERSNFGYFFPVACLNKEHHFQLPATTALIKALHLKLIQHSFSGQAMGGHRKTAQARANSAQLAEMGGFVGPTVMDPTPCFALQIAPPCVGWAL